MADDSNGRFRVLLEENLPIRNVRFDAGNNHFVATFAARGDLSFSPQQSGGPDYIDIDPAADSSRADERWRPSRGILTRRIEVGRRHQQRTACW